MKRFGVLAGLAATLAAVGTASAAPPTWSPGVDQLPAGSTEGAGAFVPGSAIGGRGVALDGAGNAMVATLSSDAAPPAGPRVLLRYRTARSGKFRDAMRIPVALNVVGPTVAINENGDALATWWSGGSVRWARHARTGGWSSGTGPAIARPYRLVAAVADNGRQHIAWAIPPAAADSPESGAGDWTIGVVTRLGGTGSWTSAAPDTIAAGDPPVLAIGTRGDVVVAWCGPVGPADGSAEDLPPNRTLLRRRAVNARVWVSQTNVPSGLGCPVEAVVGAGGDSAVSVEQFVPSLSTYSTSFVASRRGAVLRWDRTGSLAAEDPAGSAREAHTGPRLAVAQDGSLVAAWYGLAEENRLALTVSRRARGISGVWEAPVVLRQDQRLPAIWAVGAGNGGIARVSWENASFPNNLLQGTFSSEGVGEEWRATSYDPAVTKQFPASIAFSRGGFGLAVHSWLTTQDFA